MKPITVAAFDFDGTLSKGESGIRFARYLLGDCRFFLFVFFLSPLLLAYLLHFYDEAIMKILTERVFKGRDVKKTQEAASKYSHEVMPKFIKSNIKEKLLWHINEGHRCIIVSRSLSIYLKPWAHQVGVNDIIATELEEQDGIFTGKMIAGSCSGDEKVKRLEAALGARSSYFLYAYGDSKTDLPMITMADKGIWVK